MNKFAMLCAVTAGLVLSGCEVARPSEPVVGVQESKPATTSPVAQHPDPAANGGSSLQASAPYNGTATVQQNVNAAPFLVSSPASSGTGTAAAPDALTSRADGTMSGPADQPAASTGWGTSPSSTGSAGASPSKPASAKKKKK